MADFNVWLDGVRLNITCSLIMTSIYPIQLNNGLARIRKQLLEVCKIEWKPKLRSPTISTLHACSKYRSRCKFVGLTYYFGQLLENKTYRGIMKKPHKFKVYDFAHKFGATCLQITMLLLLGKLGYDIYYWRRYQLPIRKEEARLLMEQQMAEKQATEAAELSKQEKLQEEVKDIQ